MAKIQQFHKSVKAARKQIKDWRKDPFSSFAKDYGDMTVTKVTLAKTGLYGKPNVKTPTGRRLMNIHMKKKRTPAPKRRFEVELLDTRLKPTTTILRRIEMGRFQSEAVRKVRKIIPPSINLQDWRDPKKKKYSRYVFLTGEVF